MPGHDEAEAEELPMEELLLLPSPENLERAAARCEQMRHELVEAIKLPRGCLITLSVGTLIFLQSSNISLLTTTQSAVATDLQVFSEASWLTSAYLIAMSSMSPLAGRLCQIFPPRVCLFVSSFAFALGALITSTAPGFQSFLLGRVIMGIGAAGIFTISIILVLQLTGGKRRGLFVGFVNSGYTAGVALGAIIAGALVPSIGWRATFRIQAPLAAIMGTCVLYAVPKELAYAAKSSERRPWLERLAKIDYFGVITLTSFIATLLVGLSSVRIHMLPIISSATLFVIFTLIEFHYAADPIIPVVVLKSRTTLLACLAVLGLMIPRWTVLLYTPVYAIAVRNWPPVLAGLLLASANGGFAIGGLAVGWVHIRRTGSFYTSCLAVFAIFSSTLFILSRISTPHSWVAQYIVTIFVNGFCTGAALNYTLAHLLHLTQPQAHFIVSSLITTFRGFASSFGSAIGGGLFSRILLSSLEEGFEEKGIVGKHELLEKLLGSPALIANLAGVEKEVAISSYVSALTGLFTFGGALALAAIALQAGTGWNAPPEVAETPIASSGNATGIDDELEDTEGSQD